MTFSFRRAARIIPLVALGTLAVSPVSIAAENDAEARYTKLDITGTGTIQAPPDQLTARFRAESRDTSAAAAQQSVNTQVHKATDLAEKAKGVTYAVLHYSVSELRGEKDKTPPSWSASQTMTFTATDGKSLLPLTGQLQANGLLLEGLEWSLSPDKQKTLFLEAEKAAVTDAKKQAETLAATLGLKVVRFSTISVSGSSFPRPVFMAAMAARSMDSVTPPSSTAETQNVNATANATVLLAP